MSITAQSSVRPFTINQDGIAAVLAGTSLAPYAGAVWQYANQYQIDPNFFLGYSKYENGFLDGYSASFRQMNNPFDILCVNAPCNAGNCVHSVVDPCGDPSGNHGAVDCRNPGNGWCYTVYASIESGIEAAFWQTNYWITADGIADSWASLLSVAGFGPGNVTEILNNTNNWASQWPYSGNPPPPPPQPTPSPSIGLSVIGAIAGLGIILGGAYLLATNVR